MATNFNDLVAKVKNLVALAPALGAISSPELAEFLLSLPSYKTECTTMLSGL